MWSGVLMEWAAAAVEPCCAGIAWCRAAALWSCANFRISSRISGTCDGWKSPAHGDRRPDPHAMTYNRTSEGICMATDGFWGWIWAICMHKRMNLWSYMPYNERGRQEFGRPNQSLKTLSLEEVCVREKFPFACFNKKVFVFHRA